LLSGGVIRRKTIMLFKRFGSIVKNDRTGGKDSLDDG
jgi:hypothetical protein